MALGIMLQAISDFQYYMDKYGGKFHIRIYFTPYEKSYFKINPGTCSLVAIFRRVQTNFK